MTRHLEIQLPGDTKTPFAVSRLASPWRDGEAPDAISLGREWFDNAPSGIFDSAWPSLPGAHSPRRCSNQLLLALTAAHTRITARSILDQAVSNTICVTSICTSRNARAIAIATTPEQRIVLASTQAWFTADYLDLGTRRVTGQRGAVPFTAGGIMLERLTLPTHEEQNRCSPSPVPPPVPDMHARPKQ